MLKDPEYKMCFAMCRCKKIDWKKVAWDELGPADCKKYWNQIQDRIRRFRIMAELIPDARHWIAHPWTNFYKSKDHNRHPDMPKKPLSMYMLFYSEKRAEILVDNPKLSMPEVAKICSEQYQKLSDKKKARYKQRCDDMRKEYDERLAKFYRENPTLKPVKAEKVKKERPPPPPPPPPVVTSAPVQAPPAAPVQVAPQQQQPQIVTVTMPVQQPMQVCIPSFHKLDWSCHTFVEKGRHFLHFLSFLRQDGNFSYITISVRKK